MFSGSLIIWRMIQKLMNCDLKFDVFMQVSWKMIYSVHYSFDCWRKECVLRFSLWYFLMAAMSPYLTSVRSLKFASGGNVF